MSSPVSSPLAGPALRLTNAAISRARLTVVPRARTRAPRVPFVLLVLLALAVGVVGLLMFNTSMQQAAFTSSRLEDRAASLAAQEQALAVEVESLRNPQRVAEQAQAMGMVLPGASCFLALTGKQPDCAAAPAQERLRLQPVAPVKPAILDPAPITVPAPADAGREGGRHDGTRQGKKQSREGEQQTKNRGDTGAASAVSGAARGRNGSTPDRGTTTRADR